MPSLGNEKNTRSSNKVNGVNLKGIRGVIYSDKGKVTVHDETGDNYHYQTMTDQTNVDVKLGKGYYKVSNRSGGTINYDWL